MKVYALSIHADYKCRHSGACCSADWDVPVELPVYRNLSQAIQDGRLQPAVIADDSPFITEPERELPEPPELRALPDHAAAILARATTGDCAFFHRRSGLCVVHRDLGEPALPSTCRNFPRVAVRDWRGTFITLSHFCPTAASMLFRDEVPVEIVESPAAFPPADYEGLNVHTDAWPPMLHPRMLMDLEGYTAWERHMVARCSDVARLPESVVATLARDAQNVRRWRPGQATIAETIASLPVAGVVAAPHTTLDASLRLCADVTGAVPDDLKPPLDEEGLADVFVVAVHPAWMDFHAPIDRFLAAKVFASWTAYQGRGLLSIVRGLEAALALVRVEAARHCRDAGRSLDADLLREAFRSADFVLHHLALGERLAERWSRAETGL